MVWNIIGYKCFWKKATDYSIEEIEKTAYIKQYLEDVMRQNINMKGFNSLRALYLFEKGEKLEALANELEDKTGKCYDNYRKAACYLKCDADEVEAKYNKLHSRKILVKTKKL